MLHGYGLCVSYLLTHAGTMHLCLYMVAEWSVPAGTRGSPELYEVPACVPRWPLMCQSCSVRAPLQTFGWLQEDADI